MERTNISVALRTEIGKGAVRQLRAQGLIPAVLYGRGKETLVLSVEKSAIIPHLAKGAYHTHLFDLNVAGKPKGAAPITVMIKEIQRNPISGKLLNIDFHAISLTEKVQAHVPVTFIGEPPGVKQGGILEKLHAEILVSCLPTAIPDHLEVDVSGMTIGDSVHARDLALAEGVELLTSPDEVIVVLAHQARAEEVVAPVAAEEEAAEPEVLAQKGEKTEEEEKK